jgi:hypothetical protein
VAKGKVLKFHEKMCGVFNAPPSPTHLRRFRRLKTPISPTPVGLFTLQYPSIPFNTLQFLATSPYYHTTKATTTTNTLKTYTYIGVHAIQ